MAAITDSKVFVVGCARSGTTWIARIIRSSGRYVTTNESHIFPTLYSSLAGRLTGPERTQEVLGRFDERKSRAPSLGFTGPQGWVTREELAQFLAEADGRDLVGDEAARFVIGRVFDSFVERNREDAGQFLLEKTPGHLRFADRILRWWPEARIVEVIRDGRDVCASMEHKSKVRTWAASDRREQIARWIGAIRCGERLRETPAARARWLVVRYEDLIADAPREIARIYDFIAVPTDPKTVARAVSMTSFEEMQRAEETAIEPMVRALQGHGHHVRQGRVGGWRGDFSGADQRLFEEMAGDLLIALGYEL